MKLNGNEILKLVGLPESDDKVLDLFEALGADRPEVDEYGFLEDVDLEEEYGIILGFDDEMITEAQKNSPEGEFFLCEISFYSNCKFLPFGINVLDDLKTCEVKIGKRANYSSKNDSKMMFWFYKDIGWFTIFFADETFSRIDEISLKVYEDPNDEGFASLIEPVT